MRHDSPFAAVELSAAPGADALAQALRQAGFDVVVREDDAGVLWDELAFLAPLALVTSAARAPAGEARQARRSQLVAVVEEVAAVARAEGATGDAGTVLQAVDGLPETMRSSTQRDVEGGRPLELDALGGAVLRAGARHGIELPETARLVAELADAEDAAARQR